MSSITGFLVQDAIATSQERTQAKAELLVQKKAMDLQEQSALALIQSVAAPASTGAPTNVGKNINISV